MGAAKTARCGGCPVEFKTFGNQAGHCSGCHRTFRGEWAFDRHQSVADGKVTCHDPATMTDENGEPLCRSREIDGVVYWSRRPSAASLAWLASVKSAETDPDPAG